MQSSSNRPNERAASQALKPVSITNTDLAQVEAQFDSLIPGSAWCGYGTCDVGGARRLLVFVNLDNQRAMTVTRHIDGRYDLTNEDGALWPDISLAAILDRLARIGSTAD